MDGKRAFTDGKHRMISLGGEPLEVVMSFHWKSVFCYEGRELRIFNLLLVRAFIKSPYLCKNI